ncbi:MAG: hypothetical protein GKR87_01935 [Kiritimatiellae bacterium]|nr:hypothetical protein [Kiritimatiellia bacterium]
MNKDKSLSISFFARAEIGSALTILAMLSFLFLCMLLPLVGQAGAVVPYADKNFAAFTSVLFVSLTLSVLAVISKLQHKKIAGSPFPSWTMGLCGTLLFILVMLLAGLLKI